MSFAIRNVEASVDSRVMVPTISGMTDQMNVAFQQLLEAWKRRDDARRTGADIRDLGAARRDLELARGEMSRMLNT